MKHPVIRTGHSTGPWSYEYNPYRTQDDCEIPAFTINDSEGNKVFDTNEDSPAELQEANALLGRAAPSLLAALTYFFNVMHDYESSVEKGYIEQAMQQALDAIIEATRRAP